MGWLSSLFGKSKKQKLAEQLAAQAAAEAAAQAKLTLAERLANMAAQEPLFTNLSDAELEAETAELCAKDITKRNVEENCSLAAFRLMQSKGIDQEKLNECIDLLLRHAGQMQKVAMWNFYLGVAYFYAGKMHQAIRYLNTAYDDVEFNAAAERYISATVSELQMPEIKPNFADGCSTCYLALANKADTIAQEIKRQFVHKNGISHELYRQVGDILEIAFGRTAFNLDVDIKSGNARIVLLPVGNIARALQMQFFIDNCPSLVTNKLLLSLGRERNESFSVKYKKHEITASSVKCYLATDGQSYKVYMYIKELKEYLKNDFFSAYKMHLDLFSSVIGELSAACNRITFDALIKLEAPADADPECFPLSKLYDKLIEKGVQLSGSNHDLLERSFASYENDFKPEPLPEFQEDSHATLSRLAASNKSSSTTSANTVSSITSASHSASSAADGHDSASDGDVALPDGTASGVADLRPIYRRDIVKGYSRCFQLIKEFGAAEHRLCDELHDRGTIGGFIALDKSVFEGEKAKISFEDFVSQFRKSLKTGLNGTSIPLHASSLSDSSSSAKASNGAAVQSNSSQINAGQIGIFAGAAEGLTCYYLDFLCWDTKTLLERTYDILKPLHCYELTFGTFRGEVAPLTFVKRSA